MKMGLVKRPRTSTGSPKVRVVKRGRQGIEGSNHRLVDVWRALQLSKKLVAIRGMRLDMERARSSVGNISGQPLSKRELSQLLHLIPEYISVGVGVIDGTENYILAVGDDTSSLPILQSRVEFLSNGNGNGNGNGKGVGGLPLSEAELPPLKKKRGAQQAEELLGTPDHADAKIVCSSSVSKADTGGDESARTEQSEPDAFVPKDSHRELFPVNAEHAPSPGIDHHCGGGTTPHHKKSSGKLSSRVMAGILKRQSQLEGVGSKDEQRKRSAAINLPRTFDMINSYFWRDGPKQEEVGLLVKELFKKQRHALVDQVEIGLQLNMLQELAPEWCTIMSTRLSDTGERVAAKRFVLLPNNGRSSSSIREVRATLTKFALDYDNKRRSSPLQQSSQTAAS